MLSMTQTDAPRISLATPEDVKAVSEQALNIWAGALSPLWLPFWAASTVGIGLWGLGQSFKRALGGASLEGDTALLSKWPGFALSLSAPTTKAIETVEAEVVTAVKEAPKAAAKATKKAVETTIEVAEPVITETAKVIEEAPQAVAETVEKVAEPIVEVIETAPETIAETVETATDTVTETTSEAVAASEPLIDPVVETPVVPEVAEETAEADLFKPLSAKVAPKHGKKR